VKEFQAEPFDAVLDLAVGVEAWRETRKHKVLKKGSKGGRFVAVVLNEWHIDIHRFSQMFSFILPPLGRQLSSWFTTFFTPRYKMYIGTSNSETISKVISAVRSKIIQRIPIDPEGPYPFTEQGVKHAFRRMESRHAKGKVVVDMLKTQ